LPDWRTKALEALLPRITYQAAHEGLERRSTETPRRGRREQRPAKSRASTSWSLCSLSSSRLGLGRSTSRSPTPPRLQASRGRSVVEDVHHPDRTALGAVDQTSDDTRSDGVVSNPSANFTSFRFRCRARRVAQVWRSLLPTSRKPGFPMFLRTSSDPREAESWSTPGLSSDRPSLGIVRSISNLTAVAGGGLPWFRGAHPSLARLARRLRGRSGA